jgi:hypothetical protein
MPASIGVQSSEAITLAATGSQSSGTLSVSEAITLAATRSQSSGTLSVSEIVVLAAVSFPSLFVRTSEGAAYAAIHSQGPVRVSEVSVLAAVKGRSENRRTRSWGFTLDGHDFYCLRLGETATLLYDLTTQKWMQWDGSGLPYWRAQTGVNWLGLGKAAYAAGATSQVVCGDDNLGVLWVLDPDQGYDQSLLDGAPPEAVTRTVVGNVTLRGRDRARTNAVYLTVSAGSPVQDTATVSLRVSDDQGQTWYDHAILTVDAARTSNILQWRSLGVAKAPGRLFEFTDTGAMIRIDGADIEYDEQS